MKWKVKPHKPKPRHGEVRVITKFLWFPKCLYPEWRWLETASWTERYFVDHDLAYWIEQEWVDDNESR
jgi:hypothetical protein